MRKFFTCLASVAMALTLSFSASALNNSTAKMSLKGLKAQSETVTKDAKDAPLMMRTKADAALRVNPFATKSEKVMVKRVATPVAGAQRVLDGKEVVACGNYPQGLLGMRSYPELTLLDDAAANIVLQSGVFTNGKYVGSYVSNYGYYWAEYDAETWEQLNYTTTPSINTLAYSLTMDPTSGVIYGVFYNTAGNGLELGTMDATSLQRTGTIADVNSADSYGSISFDAAGNLYGITNSGNVYAIDKTTGATTLVLTSADLAGDYLTSGVIVGDTYYYAPSKEDGEFLYKVDLVGKTVTFVAEMDAECCGMQLLPAAAEAGAPDAPTNVVVTFDGLSLEGTVSFKAPTATVDGAALSGSLNYTVLLNGASVATGTVAPGDDAVADVTVAEAGACAFQVYCSNAAGDGVKSAAVNIWVGPDAPAVPSNVVATETTAGIAVTWTAVTAGAHDGELGGAVTYTVTRFVNGAESAVVAEGLTTASCLDTYAGSGNLERVYYEVVAKAAGVASVPATSNTLVLGSIIPPYTNDFESADALEGYTVIDNNGDGKTWTVVSSNGNSYVRVAYNTSKDMDDYLVLPPVTLEAGKSYDFSMAAWSQSTTFKETVEVVLATGSTVADFEAGVKVIEPTELAWNSKDADDAVLEGTMTVPVTGKYYIAIHGCSEADMYYLNVDDIAISAPFEGVTPNVVTDVVFTPMTDGTPGAEISFKAPTATIAGEPIAVLAKVEVSRDGEVVKTFDSPAGGAELSFTDVAPEDGTYEYTFVAYNNKGAGKEYTVSTYLGVDLAKGPSEVNIIEWASTPGKVTISWTPVYEDINGNTIDASLITYEILGPDGQGYLSDVIADEIPCSAGEYTFQAVDGPQDFVQYAVVAVTKKGANLNAGGYLITDMIPVGPAYSMPMIETFPEGALSYIWGYSIAEGSSSWAKFAFLNTCTKPATTPYDGDTMLYWWPVAGDEATFFSGKVHIDEVETAAFGFYFCGTTDDYYTVMPVAMIGGFTYDLLDEPVHSNSAAEGEWTRVTASLVDYVGQDIQIGIKCTCSSDAEYLLIDLLEVKEFVANDLEVASVNAPMVVEVGNDATLLAVVKNAGLADAGTYSVDLLCNGVKTETVEFDGLAVGESQEVLFALSYNLFSDISYTYQVVVNYAEDENLDNNTSDNVIVRVAQSMLPAVEDLEATQVAEGVKLTWSAPDTSASAVEFVDDAESYEDFAINQAGDWTFVDVDASGTYGFQGISFPGAYSEMSFIVFNPSALDTQALDGMTHSGDKVFACFAAETAPNDDWMISPELPGVAQTVSFFARSWTTQYGNEQFEFYYSTNSPAISDMVKLEAVDDVPAEWTEYSYELPEGAKYFAIRCVSNDRFIFLVDDISFTMGTAELTIDSYDVYRGEELIEQGVKTKSYVDTTAEAGQAYTYYVVVVYTTGESYLSNPAYIEVSGIEDITIDANDKGVYYNIQGIRVNNPEKGNIYIRVEGDKAAKVRVK